MTKAQKIMVMDSITRRKEKLQALEAGYDPKAPTLEDRRRRAGWELEFLLEHITPTLPADVRKEVQACLDLTAQVWSAEYAQAYHEAQKEASPQCLQASDSL